MSDARELPRRIGGLVKHSARKGREHLPRPVREALIRRKHLEIVSANMTELVEPAFLGLPSSDSVEWIKPARKPPVPDFAGDLYSFGPAEATRAREWLKKYPWDSDAELDARTDNFYDEIGRVRSALRARVRLSELGERTKQKKPSNAGSGGKILIDARSIQSAVHGHRGIGRFAQAVVVALLTEIDHSRIALLVDPGLDRLPSSLAGDCEQVVRVSPTDGSRFCGLVQPSPMTAPPDPLMGILGMDVPKIAVVFDFIPLDYPSVYLKTIAERLEYAANLDALKFYNDFICISAVAREQLKSFIGRGNSAEPVVAWPAEVFDPRVVPEFTDRSGPIVVVTGDEPRKNTLGALAGIGAATVGEDHRDVVVLGMSKHAALVHHLSMYAAFRPGEAVTSPRLSDSEMAELLGRASLVVVASFDEGLSLPVIEALRSGTPVVASDIAAHRELIGTGSFLADPRDPKDLSRAIRQHRGKSDTARAQFSTLARHDHAEVESAIVAKVVEFLPKGDDAGEPAQRGAHIEAPERLSIGVATPWEPQPTGVADFSAATIRALAQHADVTVYTTSEALDTDRSALDSSIEFRHVEELFDSAGDHDHRANSHNATVVVLGNSHFHVPYLELLSITDCIAVCHDTRMIELYMALRGTGGAEDLMLRTLDESAPATISPSLNDQIDDMRLLQNAGFWEIAGRSQALVLHSQSARGRIATETGVEPIVLPFASQRVPHESVIDAGVRVAAKSRLGFDSDVVHLATFGYVDFRTKLTDVVLEAAGWLVQWGQPIVLHVVGGAHDEQRETLHTRARELGVTLNVTGFVSDSVFRDYLLATDIGIQLRVSPLLGVSGPLSDLAAFGTTSVASAGLAIDVDAPDYVKRLPDWVSPVMVAEAVVAVIDSPLSEADKEPARVAYLRGKDPDLYARKLLDVIKAVSFPTES